MDENDDPYQILGVPHDATPDQIKKAYRKMALKHHPDKQSNASPEDRANAGPIFVKISNAYELLSNEEERRYYDIQQGRQSSSRSPPQNSSRRSEFNPFQPTYTSSSMPSQTYTRTRTKSKPTSTNDHHFQHHFHDPFSVFESVFREEFGGASPDSSRGGDSHQKTGDSNSNSNSNSNKVPEGGTQVSMSTAMKMINGKKVTVTERVFQMPDGSLQTRVDKQVNNNNNNNNNNKSKSTTKSSSPSPVKSTSMSSPRRRSSGNQNPTVSTKIVNGQEETTTEYPDGRVETKVSASPSSNNKNRNPKAFQFQTPPVSPALKSKSKSKSQSPSNSQTKTTTRIVNGKQETTTEYPDGRVETCTTSPRKNSTTSTFSPTSVNDSYTSPRKVVSSRPTNNTKNMALSPYSSSPTTSPIGTGTSSSSHQTRIVNGQKETIVQHTITRPDGTMETRFETKIVAM
jgi:curved DNA-binding protein CbpA